MNMLSLQRYCLLILCIVVCCTISCDSSQWIEVSLGEDHPWELASGRRFWYTIVFTDSSGVQMQQLSIGERTTHIPGGRRGTTIIAAYPLGSGIPLGGAYHAGVDERKVTLTFADGPLARTLLQVAHRWPSAVAQSNFSHLAKEISFIDSRGICIDWTRLSKAVVEGNVGPRSFVSGEAVDISISEIPPGRWHAETTTLDPFHAFSHGDSTVRDLTPGVFRYLNLDHMLELRIVVPDDSQEAVFWHAIPADTLLRVSDATYQKLLEGGGRLPIERGNR